MTRKHVYAINVKLKTIKNNQKLSKIIKKRKSSMIRTTGLEVRHVARVSVDIIIVHRHHWEKIKLLRIQNLKK